MMLLILREGLNKESITSYKRHEAMNEIINAVLSPTYANPKEFPKFTETVMSLPFIMSAPFVYCSTLLTTTCIQAGTRARYEPQDEMSSNAWESN
jgi:hypothetical protein